MNIIFLSLLIYRNIIFSSGLKDSKGAEPEKSLLILGKGLTTNYENPVHSEEGKQFQNFEMLTSGLHGNKLEKTSFQRKV